MHHSRLLAAATLASLPFLLTGCGLNGTNPVTKPAPIVTGSLTLNGSVHGGQQPVSGAAIKLYAAGSTGYGSASTLLLNSGVTVLSGADGSFTLTGLYACTSPEQRVYLTATGGNAGSGNNPAMAEMAALGRCGDLTASTFIAVSEVTTVASVWALSPFMSGINSVGAPASNTGGLINAFADVNSLANISTGTSPGANLPAGAVMPIRAIDTLADVLAACVNSTGAGTACTTLFSNASYNGNVPTDTVGAALAIAQHPASNVAALYGISTAAAPFQPTLAEAPTDWTLAATFTPGLTTPTSVATDASGAVWVTDSATGKVTHFSHAGASLITASGLNAPAAIAVDQSGNAWVANKGNSTVAVINPAGAVSTYTGGGLNLPVSVSLDGQGNVWLTNSGAATVSEFSNTGAPLSGSGFSSPSGTAVAVAANPR